MKSAVPVRPALKKGQSQESNTSIIDPDNSIGDVVTFTLSTDGSEPNWLEVELMDNHNFVGTPLECLEII